MLRIRQNVMYLFFIMSVLFIGSLKTAQGYNHSDPTDDHLYQRINTSNYYDIEACRPVGQFPWIDMTDLMWEGNGTHYNINVSFAVDVIPFWNQSALDLRSVFVSINLNGTSVTEENFLSSQIEIHLLDTSLIINFNDNDEYNETIIQKPVFYQNNISISIENQLCENMSNALPIANWYIYAYSMTTNFSTDSENIIIYSDWINIPFLSSEIFPICGIQEENEQEEKEKEWWEIQGFSPILIFAISICSLFFLRKRYSR